MRPDIQEVLRLLSTWDSIPSINLNVQFPFHKKPQAKQLKEKKLLNDQRFQQIEAQNKGKLKSFKGDIPDSELLKIQYFSSFTL